MGIFKRLRKQIAVALLLLFFTNMAQAADPDYTWKCYASTNNVISVFVDGNKIYKGTNGGLLISNDSGSTWVHKTVADGLGSNVIYKIYASGSNIYLGTIDGLCISTDSGNTWVTKTTADGMGYHNNVYDVVVVGSTIYVAAFNGGGLSISTDHGNTWITKTTSNGLANNTLRAVSVVGTTIYAGTSSGLSISTDSGSTWITKTTSNGLASNNIMDLLISGSNIYVSTPSGLSISTDNGSSWTNKTTSTGLGYDQILTTFVSGSNIYVGTNGGGLSISTDNGNTWITKTTTSGLASNYARDIYVSGSTIYVATNTSGLSISTDNGSTWSTQLQNNMIISNNTWDVYVSGSNIYLATYYGLSISTDNGNTWITKLGNELIRDIYVFETNIYATSNNGLWISTNGGSTWVNKKSTNGLGSNYVQGTYAIGSNVYAATTAGLSISTDGGTTWITKTTTDGLGNNNTTGVYVSNSGSKIYVSTSGGLSISTDSGSTWINKTTTDGLAKNDVTVGICVNGSNIYVPTSGGLAISTDSGSSFIAKTTSNGLGNNSVFGISVSGSNIYAATSGGLSISTDSGNTWINKTTTNGLANNSVYGVYASGSSIYAATGGGGLSVATPKSGGESVGSILSYLFNKSGDEVTYTASKSGTAFGIIKMRESKIGVGSMSQSNFSDVVMNITPAGKPNLIIPVETNAIAATVNNDLTDTALVTASFTGLPKQKTGRVPPIMMNGLQISDSKGQVFPGIEPVSGLPYTSFVRNISWNNTTGTLTFEILHFTEYGVPVLIGKAFAGTGAGAALNANGSNIVVSYSGGSITGTVTQNRTVSVKKISGLAYETVLSDVPGTANNLYKPMVPGVTYNISFEYINRGNADDQVDLTTAITRTNDGHFTVGGNESKTVVAWQVASFNVEIDADNAYAYERATVDVTVDLNGVNAVSYNAFSNAYEGATFAADGQYGGVDDLSYRFVLEAEGYSLTILSRSVTVNAPTGYTGTPVSETNLVPGVQITYFVAVKNNNNSVATSINLTDVIPNSCHLYYTTTPNVTGTTRWDWQGATDNAATNATNDAVKFEITIPALSTVTASYTVTLD